MEAVKLGMRLPKQFERRRLCRLQIKYTLRSGFIKGAKMGLLNSKVGGNHLHGCCLGGP